MRPFDATSNDNETRKLASDTETTNSSHRLSICSRKLLENKTPFPSRSGRPSSWLNARTGWHLQLVMQSDSIQHNLVSMVFLNHTLQQQLASFQQGRFGHKIIYLKSGILGFIGVSKNHCKKREVIVTTEGSSPTRESSLRQSLQTRPQTLFKAISDELTLLGLENRKGCSSGPGKVTILREGWNYEVWYFLRKELTIDSLS